MKTFIIILLSCLFLSTSIMAEEKKEEVKYRVKIEVVYNELSIEDANEKIAKAHRDHKDACNVIIESKKVNNLIDITAAIGSYYIVSE